MKIHIKETLVAAAVFVAAGLGFSGFAALGTGAPIPPCDIGMLPQMALTDPAALQRRVARRCEGNERARATLPGGERVRVRIARLSGHPTVILQAE